MMDWVIFETQRLENVWWLMREGKRIAQYKNQGFAEAAMARMCRAEVRNGNHAKATFHRTDGSIAVMRTYDKKPRVW